jgi:hypothetical protein
VRLGLRQDGAEDGAEEVFPCQSGTIKGGSTSLWTGLLVELRQRGVKSSVLQACRHDAGFQEHSHQLGAREPALQRPGHRSPMPEAHCEEGMV